MFHNRTHRLVKKGRKSKNGRKTNRKTNRKVRSLKNNKRVRKTTSKNRKIHKIRKVRKTARKMTGGNATISTKNHAISLVGDAATQRDNYLASAYD